MLDVVIVEPLIAPNTGAIIRLCANAGARLHLVEPLGFTLDDAALRRGGLDYHELSDTRTWESWAACRAGIGTDRRWFATTANASRRYDAIDFQTRDVVVFGRETAGLGPAVLADVGADHRLLIPMRAGNRSINLANAVSIVVYEAWRQHDFAGSAPDKGGVFEESFPALPPTTQHA